MSIDLIAKGQDFSALNMGYVPEVPGGLQYLNFFGGGVARDARNLADGSDLELMGSPSHDVASTTFTPNLAYVRTRTVQPLETTILLCARLADVASMLLGTYHGARATGDGFAAARGLNVWTSPGTVGDGLVGEVALVAGSTSGVAGAASANFSTALPLVPVGWAFLSFSISAAMSTAAKNHTTGASVTNASAQTLDRNTHPFHIGGTPVAAGFPASNEIAFAAIYNRVLSVDEKDAMYRSVKRFVASKSIVV